MGIFALFSTGTEQALIVLELVTALTVVAMLVIVEVDVVLLVSTCIVRVGTLDGEQTPLLAQYAILLLQYWYLQQEDPIMGQAPWPSEQHTWVEGK